MTTQTHHDAAPLNGQSATAALTAALAAMAAPLRFAARHQFDNIDRIKDLEATVHKAALRAGAAAKVAGCPHAVATLRTLAAHLPAAGAPHAQRAAALAHCLREVEALAATLGPSQQASSHGPPQRTGGVAAKTPIATPRGHGPVKTAPKPAAKKATRQASGLPPPAPDAAPRARPVATSRHLTPLTLQSPVLALSGVADKVAARLAARGIVSIGDLLRFLPRRYQGRDACQALANLQPGHVAVAEGLVHSVHYRAGPRRRSLEVVLGDDSGFLHLTWFRVPGRGYAEQFVRGARVRAAGTVKRFRGRMQMAHPEVRLLAAEPDNSNAEDPAKEAAEDEPIVPIYLDVEGLHPRALRRVMAQALRRVPHVQDPVPQALLLRRNLPSLTAALGHLHAPGPDAALEDLQTMKTPWQRRLIYDELLLLQLAVLQTRVNVANDRAHPLEGVDVAPLARELLPFAPTAAQARVLQEIALDLRQPRPMQRLLQGDVGSGKTAVAWVCLLAAVRAGLQGVLMAPTEILAEQHARAGQTLLGRLGIQVSLLTGGLSKKERQDVLTQCAAGGTQVVIGTHALLQDTVSFNTLGMVIIDEQHRFGVMQRARLRSMGHQGLCPHTLVMTATPIPRTLALTVYGDLDVSIIDMLPPGRTPIETRLYDDGKRDSVYQQVNAAVQAGRQAYVIFPLVEESDKEGMESLRDAKSQAEDLAAGALCGVRVRLLHGRMSSDEKDAVMRAFAAHEVDVLVATTVVEVGIDVPNATVMVIEHAERFGLSQLHQLRGRVGRGEHASQCYLLARRKKSDDAWRRLSIMVQTNDGFRIAEEDLDIRGPGDIIGTRQAGLPMLCLADLSRDKELLVQARQDAKAILACDPALSSPEHDLLKAWLKSNMAGTHALARVG